jgi:gliding motility-associated-like protein
MMLRFFKAGILALFFVSFAAVAQDPGYAVSSVSLNSGGTSCAVCDVVNETDALGNTPGTNSTIVLNGGSTDGFVSQTLQFAEIGDPGDMVTVLFELADTLIGDLNAQGNMAVNSALGGVVNNDSKTLNNGGITLLGAGKFYFVFESGASFDRVTISINAGTVAAGAVELKVFTARINKFADFVSIYDSCEKPGTHTDGIAGTCQGAPAPTCSVTNPTFAYDADPATASEMSVALGLGAEAFQRVFWDNPSCSTDSIYVKFGIEDALFNAGLLGNVILTPYFNGVAGTPVLFETQAVTALAEESQYYLVHYPQQVFDAVEIRIVSTAGFLFQFNVYDICMIRQAPPRAADGRVVNVCHGDDVTVSLNPTPSTLSRWYLTPTGGSPLIDGPNRTIYADGDSMLVKNNTVTTTYYLESFNTNNGCTSQKRDSVIVSVYPQVPEAFISDTLIACYKDVVTIAPQPLGSIFRFYSDSLGTMPIDTATSLTIFNITNDTTFYVVNTYLDICPSDVVVPAFIKVLDDVVSPGIRPVYVFCSTTDQVSISVPNPVAGATYRWYDTEDQSVNAPTFVGTEFVFPNGVTANDTLYVEGQKGFCDEGRRYPVYIFASTEPDVTVPDSVLYVCDGDSVNVFAESTNPLGQFAWYDSLTSTTPIFLGNPFVAVDNDTIRTLYVEAKFENCASDVRKRVDVISVDELQNNLDELSSAACRGEDLLMELILDIDGLDYRWYDIDDNLIADNESFTVPALANDTSFYLEITQLPCLGQTRILVEIVVVDPPTIAVANQIKYYCTGDAVLLEGQPSVGATINWYDEPVDGNLLIIGNPVNYAPPASFADTAVVWAQGNIGRCGSADRVAVALIRSDDVAQAVVNVPVICIGANATLVAQSLIPNTGFKWYDAPVNGNQIGAGPTFNTGTLNQTTTYYVENLFNGICSGTARTEVEVIVEDVLASPTTSCSQATGSDFVEFVWDDVPGVVEYIVTIDNGAPFTLPAGTTTFRVDGLDPSTTVEMRIQAKALATCSTSPIAFQACTSELCSQILAATDQAVYDVCEGETAVVTLLNLPVNAVVELDGVIRQVTSFNLGPNAVGTKGYDFRIWVANQPMCDTLSFTTQVNTYALPVIDIDVEVRSTPTVGQFVNSFRFINNSADNNSWLWNFGDGTISTEYSPVHNYTTEGEYDVTLTVTSSFGCVATGRFDGKIQVSTVPDIFIPNTFTPNNDTKNDFWRVFAKNIIRGDVRVFNQYGNLVFESDDWEAEWDGTYNGEDLPSGVYVYQVILFDYLEIKYEKEGTINLIRK